MPKRIKLMAEYNSHPIWSMETDSLGPIDPATLPLTQETIVRLRLWVDRYQAQLNMADPANSAFLQGKELVEFEEEGIRLWLKLREELGPEYAVAYFSERLRRLLDNPEELKLKDEPLG